jgi:hypothetical protein
MIDMVEAMGDPNLLGAWFSGPSWACWRSVLRAAFGLKMSADDLKLFRGVAERDPPARRVRECGLLPVEELARTRSPATPLVLSTTGRKAPTVII